MNDDDFLALIALVQTELRNSGAAAVTNDRHYLIDEAVADEKRLLPPRKHLLALLEAFGRHMAVRDYRTYLSSIEGINRHLDRPTWIERAVVVPAQGETPRDEIDLSHAPDLSGLREALSQLVSRLREAPTSRAFE